MQQGKKHCLKFLKEICKRKRQRKMKEIIFFLCCYLSDFKSSTPRSCGGSKTPLPLFLSTFVSICQALIPYLAGDIICERSLKLAVCPFKDLHVQDNSLKTKYDILQFVSYDIIAKIVQTDLAQVRRTKDIERKNKKQKKNPVTKSKDRLKSNLGA